MLKRIKIENFAIIESIDISFDKGFNILTGETGAGKSIIVGAMNALLGDRMSSGSLRQGSSKGFIEGYFEFQVDGISSDLILRREFSNSGSGKTTVNGKQVTLLELRETINSKVDLHSQHQHQTLMDEKNYYSILDSFGDFESCAKETSVFYKTCFDLREEQRHLIDRKKKAEEMRDFLEFQLKEIHSIDPQPNEDIDLENEFSLLSNVENIVSYSSDSYKRLYDSDESAAANIRAAIDNVSKLSTFIQETEKIREDLNSALVSVEESALLIQKYAEGTTYNPARIEEINQRLSQLKQLTKKHQTDLNGIIEKADEISNDLSNRDTLVLDIEEIGRKIENASENYAKQALKLSSKRMNAAIQLEKAILSRLAKLGMEKSLFQVQVVQRGPQDEFESTIPVNFKDSTYYGNKHGIDRISFLVATGKSERILPVSQIASGGELSRIMLAIKSVISDSDNVPVLIFDEIDSGISGRIASAVGRELKALSTNHQLFCITHLPQIAGLGDHHFSVEKIEKSDRIITTVVKLDDTGRKNEIAKLLAGDSISDTHLKSAEEMLKK